MAATATVLVKEGKTEKVVNLKDYEKDQQGDKRYTLVATPSVEVEEVDVTRVPASSGQHAQIQAQAAYARNAAQKQISAPSMANVDAAAEEGEAPILETVVDDTNLPTDIGSVKPIEELQAEAEVASANVEQAAQDAQQAGKKKR